MRTAATGSTANRCRCGRRGTFTQATISTTISQLLHPVTCSLTKTDGIGVRNSDSSSLGRELIGAETRHKDAALMPIELYRANRRVTSHCHDLDTLAETAQHDLFRHSRHSAKRFNSWPLHSHLTILDQLFIHTDTCISAGRVDPRVGSGRKL